MAIFGCDQFVAAVLWSELADDSIGLVSGAVVLLDCGMELGGGLASMVSGVVVLLDCRMELGGGSASGRAGAVGFCWFNDND